MSFQRPSKEQARESIAGLVQAYSRHAAEYSSGASGYTEADARRDFIDPFLQSLGWDVGNQQGLSQVEREVVLERGTDDEGNALGRPDYRMRVAGRDRMPVEAKKPAVSLSSPSAARQARSYGWSLSLPAAVLTNFAELVVYDTTVAPEDDDDADVAARPNSRFTCDEYVDRFDELWALLSHESIGGDGFYEVYDYEEPPRGESPFDRSFLHHFREWRLQIASDISVNNPNLGAAEVGRRTQRLMNALLFLRVCEDRNITKYEDLLSHAESNAVIEAFRFADQVFNAGLFSVLSDTAVTDDVLADVIRELYWPRTKFAFGLLDPEILAALYEQYLAERVSIAEDGSVSLVPKPELTHAGGVVPTPAYIVEELVREALEPALPVGQPIPEGFALLDLSHGSGPFLVAALRYLITVTERSGIELDLSGRADLVTKHIFGVDIDPEAVEVTRLSLLLAILDDAPVNVATSRHLLPELASNIQSGNALIDSRFDTLLAEVAASPRRRAAVAPFDIHDAFRQVLDRGGFDVVVGNPPYTRIQVLSEHLPDQLAYFQHPGSGFQSSLAYNFDVYMLFVERALELLGPNGRLAYIAPHRFTNSLAGAPLRALIGPRLERLVHFGEEQVFPGRTTYSALLILGPAGEPTAELQLVRDLQAWKSGVASETNTLYRPELTADPWQIASEAQAHVFDKMDQSAIARLGEPNWVHIFVGVQTSADGLYFIVPIDEESDQDQVTFTDLDGRQRSVERAILRPAIRDRELLPFDIDPPPDALAIFPYELVEPGNGRRPAAVPLSRQRMAADFPLTLEYFDSYESELRDGRAMPDPGEEFWRYGRSQSLTVLDEPKLVVRVLSLTPRYALDTRGLVVPGGGDGGPYYLLRPRPECPLSPQVLIALLSSPIVDAYVASSGKAYRGSYVVHRKAFLANLPVPDFSAEQLSRIEEAVGEIHSLRGAIPAETDSTIKASMAGRLDVLVRHVDSIVAEAYGLTPDDVSAVVG